MLVKYIDLALSLHSYLCKQPLKDEDSKKKKKKGENILHCPTLDYFTLGCIYTGHC